MYISREEINGASQGWSSTHNFHQSIYLPNICRVTIVLKDNFETICVDLNTTIPVRALGNFLLIHLTWQIRGLRSWNQGFELNYTKYTNQVYENNIWNKWVTDSLTLGIDFQLENFKKVRRLFFIVQRTTLSTGDPHVSFLHHPLANFPHHLEDT